jgi:GcrA cell cycle regulator
MDWNDDTIAKIRALWGEGLSTAEIGRRMGVSKNSIVGKAHRLNLPPRPSPIRREGPVVVRPRVVQPRRVMGPTLPSFADGAEAAAQQAESEATGPTETVMAMPHAVVQPPQPPPLPPPPAPAPVVSLEPVAPEPEPMAERPAALPRPPAIRVVPPRPARFAACCWPLGEPGTKTFHFCDAEATQGKPYCQAHAQLAYVKVRDRREDAA